MYLKNTREYYGYIAQALHWIIAFSFIAMFVIAEVMNAMTSDKKYTFFDQSKWELYALHKSIGLALLVLVLLRVLWRFSNPTPANIGTWWQHIMAKIVHLGLYVVMIGLPISGYVMSAAGGYDVAFFGIEIPSLLEKSKPIASLAHKTHFVLADATYILVLLHVTGALFHHYVLKDVTFIRLFWRGPTKK